ncbi:class I SAM-dependent methyltransferase [Stieleria sp. ICT_E10.1]|uniref:class I SAM-dependent methyltransferase n=1 Tax=Stieleria sedimenti TaxID=2976331 RepID=UPI00217FBE9A|nr:class I SAM-dependent methyltransferase [Stieleria sedimenti]MCS7467590.1 class I SAM-dependent methyltransferase [Stieleria sedimenti]
MSETRFAFGENWTSFLNHLDEDRIDQACRSLTGLLCLDDAAGRPLEGQRFLDLGSGSGLFSLAASRLGAEVVSIDFDHHSVACTEQLRQRESTDPTKWEILQGSALDESLMESLGPFDVVYSWGVLHHTGRMDRAIELAAARVAVGGRFAIAIYNDQGGGSRRWLKIKQIYHRLPKWARPVWVTAVASWYEFKFALARLVGGRNPLPFADWRKKRTDRGMSAWHDWVDWIGGLPFEVAKPEAIIVPLVAKHFQLINLTTVGNGWGCNEYVFKKVA